VLEVMACGAAVVASNASSLPEVSGEAVLSVDPTSVADLAKAMKTVLESDELCNELRRKGPAQASRFSWERAARETMEVYRSVAKR